jgi:peroxiredoxin Q/BCP
MKLSIGDVAPDFSLKNTLGESWKLSDKLGKVVALLFYPGDETIVCTKQMCSVRDNWSEYVDTGAEVVGISPGTENEHHAFAAHHSLPMPLLADSDRAITKLFGSHSFLPIWTTRAVVVIDAKGIIRYRNIMVRAFRPGNDEVLAAIHLAKYDALAERRTQST